MNKQVLLVPLLFWLSPFALLAQSTVVPLVTELPVRPWGAVLHDGELYFSAQQNSVPGCPAAESYRISSVEKRKGSVEVEQLGPFECVLGYQILGKHLVLMSGSKTGVSYHVMENRTWVPLEESLFRKPIRDRRAWLKYELVVLSEKLKGSSFEKPETAPTTLADNLLDVPGLTQVLTVRSSSGDWMYVRLPIEDSRPHLRALVRIEGLPSDWGSRPFQLCQSSAGPLLLYETEQASTARPRMFLWNPSTTSPATAIVGESDFPYKWSSVQQSQDGFLILGTTTRSLPEKMQNPRHTFSVDFHGQVAPGPHSEKDLFGISASTRGFVLSFGYSNSIALENLEGDSKESLQPLTAKKPTSTFSVPQWPRLGVKVCDRHRLDEEADGTWSIFYHVPLFTKRLATVSNITSVECNGDALAIVGRYTAFSNHATSFALTKATSNIKSALELGTENTSFELASSVGLLQLFKGDSLVLVRAPLVGTEFSRVRSALSQSGFKIWLSDAMGPFGGYVNVVDSDGLEFYVDDSSMEAPPADKLGNLENQ